jgi:hypothetical protein
MCRGLLGGIGPEITAGHVPRFSEHVVGGKRYSSGTPVGTGRISNPGSSISDFWRAKFRADGQEEAP